MGGGEFAATIQNGNQTKSDHEEEEFHSFALLVTEPVHEKVLMLDADDDTDHHYHDRSSRHACPYAENEQYWTKEFNHNDQKSNFIGYPDNVCEIVHGTVVAMSAPPSEQFLRPVREQDDPDCKPR
jgi:hypothetical protein